MLWLYSMNSAKYVFPLIVLSQARNQTKPTDSSAHINFARRAKKRQLSKPFTSVHIQKQMARLFLISKCHSIPLGALVVRCCCGCGAALTLHERDSKTS